MSTRWGSASLDMNVKVPVITVGADYKVCHCFRATVHTMLFGVAQEPHIYLHSGKLALAVCKIPIDVQTTALILKKIWFCSLIFQQTPGIIRNSHSNYWFKWMSTSQQVQHVCFLYSLTFFYWIWVKNQTFFSVYIPTGGKWWTAGEQNELTCTGILETTGSERCFHEGT